MHRYLLSLISFFISYIFIFFYFFFSLENNFSNNFKYVETAKFYEKYFEQIEHIRFNKEFENKEITNELIFNYLKKEEGRRTILFQGDSWMQQINDQESSKDLIKFKLKKYSNIINAGTASYSPSLIFKQFKILENDFKIYPDTVVVYIDQTDMGDELCRYKKLTKFNKNGEIEKVPGELYPYYRDVFNLHEKISLSSIEHTNTNKIFKTQLLINYKIKKALYRILKRIRISLSDEKNTYKKCRWEVIENYKQNLNINDKKYLIKILKSFFSYLEKKDYLNSVIVVTHPHKLQLQKKNELNDISDIVAKSVLGFEKINHINYTKVLKEKKIYKNFTDIWFADSIHLLEENFNLFLINLLDQLD